MDNEEKLLKAKCIIENLLDFVIDGFDYDNGEYTLREFVENTLCVSRYDIESLGIDQYLWVFDNEEDEAEDEDEAGADLPDELVIDMSSFSTDEIEENIGDVLSDEYGFCVKGFVIKDDSDPKNILVSNIIWDTED